MSQETDMGQCPISFFYAYRNFGVKPYCYNYMFDNFFKKFKKEDRSVAYTGALPSFSVGGGGAVSNANAFRHTPVFAAIRLRSEMLAALPKVLLREDPVKGYVKVTDHPLYRIIHRAPNTYMNAFDFWMYLNACLDGWGNAYALIEWQNGQLKALHPIHPSNVVVKRNSKGKVYAVNGSTYFDGKYLAEDIVHLMGMSIDGVKGLDPIMYNQVALSTGIEAAKFGDEYFKNGGNVKAVLETDGNLSPDAYQRFMENFRKSTQMSHGTPLLEYGVKYKSIGVSPETAQMLATKTFSIQDVSRIFNVPPHLLSDLSHATFSNIEEQNIQFVTHSILPAAKRFEAELESKLLSEDEGLEVKFNFNGYLRGNTSARGEFYNKMLSTGAFCRNDVRELEGLERVEGLDTFLYPANMVPVGEKVNENV